MFFHFNANQMNKLQNLQLKIRFLKNNWKNYSNKILN